MDIMAQNNYTLRDVPDQKSEDCIPEYQGTESHYQLDLGGIQNIITMKRLSLKRRPRGVLNDVEKTQSGASSGPAHSAESLSLPGNDGTRLLGMSSSAKGRPPLPPPHSSLLDDRRSKGEGPGNSQRHTEPKPQQTERNAASQRPSPGVEQSVLETHKHISQSPPQPLPRRRLASFGGISPSGSHSPFTGLGAYNQNNNGNKPDDNMSAHLTSSLGSRGSTGCLKLSPQSSGRSTPVTSLGSMHLQHVRDQMVVALKKLKELEEQVKIIPILQVKISVLQEEKRQLVSQLSDSKSINDMTWKTCLGEDGIDFENKRHTEAESEGTNENVYTDFREFRELTEEMQALERTIKGGHMLSWQEKGHGLLHKNTTKFIGIKTDIDMKMTLSKTSKENKSVHTDRVETRSIATEVTEVSLGIHTKHEAELEAQQLLNAALKERISQLETELKESALQTELTRLKLELQAAGARNRVDKSCFAKPHTESVGTTTRPCTQSQGVGNHKEFQDASTGEAAETKTVGVSCKPKTTDICTGLDVPMSHWEIRERVETSDKAVGIHVFTSTVRVGTEIKLSDAESNTELPLEKQVFQKEKVKCHSVACGAYSVDLTICESKDMISQGITTDSIRRVDQGILASPQMASQRTNTVSSSVSRFTNTSQTFSNDSSTNTLLSKHDKHTNTSHTFTRTISVGNGVGGIICTTESRTVGVNTANLECYSKLPPDTVNKATRDCGVGLTNIYENFLVGLKTRNMASGPSHIPDPIKTRSIGVGDGRIRDFSVSSCAPKPKFQQPSQFQWDHELNHYIEKMHRLLKEHGDQSDHYPSSKPLSNIKSMTEGEAVIHRFTSHPADLLFPSRPLNVSKEHSEISQQDGNESEVKKMIKMLEQQAASALQDRSANAAKPWSAMKKQGADQCHSSNRKSMKFMKVSAGLEPTSACEPEEREGRGSDTVRKVSPEGWQAKKGKDGSNKGSKGSLKLSRQHRCNLSERMFSACQALKMHLSENPAMSSRELDCLCLLQQEWFSVSSQKSAAPDTVGEYLSAFQMISPSVLQHVVNMADGNGNTALHYSVSHSNFGVVKKLLDAEVCNVNQQNAAGYTPVMLAALAAVERPDDMRVVEQLFSKGDVNAKAIQAGQTALMLAVSHGRLDMVRALLAQGAKVNIQDDEGSTALMCASEHGHVDIVKLLLAQPNCDATLTDSDDSSALSVALEAGHNDIAVLLYAHANFSRCTAGAARHSGRFPSSSGGWSIFET
ncbi:KN motif and ankyrin repeat domain-containing protein 1-like isoform X2 [Poecilia reticulata]|uniref:KN motif and ankyrin repeat domain-containing protein 1-like isoform X2 n=1 Tax=Poecilia reticulata TaxID=8081 RepID=UPI0004A4549E|nr:PREDICTED: KN motif and ankyrin repeat domain-containing protein 1-like isoform X2 [Poecilia reticulata]